MAAFVRVERVDAALDIVGRDVTVRVDAHNDVAVRDFQDSIEPSCLMTTRIVDHPCSPRLAAISRVRSVEPPSATITSTIDP